MEPDQVRAAYAHLAAGINGYLEQKIRDGKLRREDIPAEVFLVAIKNGGTLVAEQVAASYTTQFGANLPIAYIDPTLWRDDVHTNLIVTAKGDPLILPNATYNVDGKHGIFIDSVVESARSFNAARTGVDSFGRLASTGFAVLLDRPARQMPYHPDIAFQKDGTIPSDLVAKVVAEGSNHYMVLQQRQTN